MRFRRRRWMGPKHGVPRGVAVFSSSKSGVTKESIGPLAEGQLREWCAAHGVALTDDFASLQVLDAHLDQWYADPLHYDSVDLGNGAGIYLGNVIVMNVVGCQWRVWPNGHPIIRLESGQDLDVIAMAGERLMRSGPSLPSIFTGASTG